MARTDFWRFRRHHARVPAGRRLAAWRHPELLLLPMAALIALSAPAKAGVPEVVWKERIEVASGNAHQGPWRMNESRLDYVDDPTVALGEQGGAWVVWAEQSRQDIFLQAFEADGTTRFEDPVNVSRSPGIFSWLPRIVVNSGDGKGVFVLWQEIIFSGGSHGGEILFARSTDGGKTFGTPVNLSNSIAGAGKGRLTRDLWHNGSLDLALGPGGNLHAAWTEYEGALRFSTSTDQGVSFSPPLHIAGGEAAPARGPSLAAGPDGTVHIAWTVGEDGAADIRFATSRDTGRSFDTPQILFASEGHADAPKIAVDGTGAVHLVYAESPGGPFQGYHIRYARSDDRGRTFEGSQEIVGPRQGRFESMNFPNLGLDGRGDPYLLWELFPHRRGRPQGLGFSRSSDGGRTFAPPSVVPGSVDPQLGFNGGLQGLLTRKLAVNEAGEVAVATSTFKPNEKSHVWLFRGAAADD